MPSAHSGSYIIENVCNVPARFEAKGTGTKHYTFCDMETDGGKWIVIQRRINGSISFNRNWTDYVYGFGDLESEFWYGLEKINCLTERDDVELRIELGNGTEPSVIWTYKLFKVGDATTNFKLTIGPGVKVKGNWTYDTMAYHNGAPFSTPDHQTDTTCASSRGSGWWFKNCLYSNLNGKYPFQNPYNSNPYYWLTW